MSTKKITLPTHFIDLHLHLDGAITLDIAKVLAKLQNQTLPSSSDAELSKLLSIPPDCEDLNEYLRRFVFQSHYYRQRKASARLFI